MRGQPDNRSADPVQTDRNALHSLRRLPPDREPRLSAGTCAGQARKPLPGPDWSGMEVPEAGTRDTGLQRYIYWGNLRLGINQLARFPAFQHSQCRLTNMRNGFTNVKLFSAARKERRAAISQPLQPVTMPADQLLCRSLCPTASPRNDQGKPIQHGIDQLRFVFRIEGLGDIDIFRNDYAVGTSLRAFNSHAPARKMARSVESRRDSGQSSVKA